jgi:hypothetical protein
MRCFIRTAVILFIILRGSTGSAGDERARRGIQASVIARGTGGSEALSDSVPTDFPSFQIPVFDDPSPGKLFMTPLARGTPQYTYLTILDDNFTPLYYAKRAGSMTDFKVHPNGLLTFFDSIAKCYYVMNEEYAIIDSFRCVNGYEADSHDFQFTSEGHGVLLSYDTRTVDMSVLVPGGNPAAKVTGLVIQELDREKHLVFEWKSWDHFSITDAVGVTLTAANVDYVHANSLAVDTDGDLLLSSRHLDEITKIHRPTGEIVWRFGGRNNQFTFTNDSLGFSHQHDVRRLPNGNITMFDNGNFHVPAFSRGVEYRLDEETRTAELVWQYRNSPDIFAFATGSVQRLPNGNTLISWGTSGVVTEVRPDGAKALELLLSPPQSFTTYRTLRFPWTTTGVAVPPALPAAVTLLPAYPNPFNPTTTIPFSLQRAMFVTLKVFNTLGQEIATLVSEVMSAGSHATEWNAGNAPSGMYFYRLQAGNIARTGRVLLLR